MSHDVTKTLATPSEMQAQPLHVSVQQIAAVQDYLIAVRGLFVEPVISLDGTVILIDANGEEAGEITPEGDVCMNDGDEFHVDDAQAAVSKGPSSEDYDAYLESMGDKVPVVEVDESKQTANSAKKYSESSEVYTQPLVSDSIDEGPKVEPVETVKIEEDDGLDGEPAGADDPAGDIEAAQPKQQTEQAQVAPEGAISNPGIAPQQETPEIALPSFDVASAVSDAIGSGQAANESVKAAKASGERGAPEKSGVDIPATLIEGAARAVRVDEDELAIAQLEQAIVSPGSSPAGPKAADEAQPEFDGMESRKRADAKPVPEGDPFAKEKGEVEPDPAAPVAGKYDSNSKNPLSAGGMAMYDPAGTLVAAKEHARFGAPPHFFAANFAQDNAAALKEVHHDVVLPTHGRDGHNDRQDRNGEDEGQGGYFTEEDDAEEQAQVTSIA